MESMIGGELKNKYPNDSRDNFLKADDVLQADGDSRNQ
jgi:hypothetical protein